jgi:hypothetical protein
MPREMRDELEKAIAPPQPSSDPNADRPEPPPIPGSQSIEEREAEAAREAEATRRIMPTAGEGIFGTGQEGQGAVVEMLQRILRAIEDLPVEIMDELESRFD